MPRVEGPESPVERLVPSIVTHDGFTFANPFRVGERFESTCGLVVEIASARHFNYVNEDVKAKVVNDPSDTLKPGDVVKFPGWGTRWKQIAP